MLLYAAGGGGSGPLNPTVIQIAGRSGQRNFLLSYAHHTPRHFAQEYAKAGCFSSIEVPDQVGTDFLAWCDGRVATVEAFEEFLEGR